MTTTQTNYLVNVDGPREDICLTRTPVEVRKNVESKFYANHFRLGCGRDSETAEMAIRNLFADHGCHVLQIVEAPTTEVAARALIEQDRRDAEAAAGPEIRDLKPAEEIASVPTDRQVGRLLTPEAVNTFMFGGKATVTLVSEKTGVRFTYKVRESDDGHMFFVSLLTGSDNESSYAYLGHFRGPDYSHGRKSKIGADAPGAKAFAFFARHLSGRELPAGLQVWHEGRCGVCGRKLTVPSSVASGIGPQCAAERGIVCEPVEPPQPEPPAPAAAPVPQAPALAEAPVSRETPTRTPPDDYRVLRLIDRAESTGEIADALVNNIATVVASPSLLTHAKAAFDKLNGVEPPDGGRVPPILELKEKIDAAESINALTDLMLQPETKALLDGDSTLAIQARSYAKERLVALGWPSKRAPVEPVSAWTRRQQAKAEFRQEARR